MKVSKRAIKELFRQERDSNEFLDFLKEYFSGDLDPMKPKDWVIYEWNTYVDIFDMNKEGAEQMKHYDVDDKFALDITSSFDDGNFHRIIVDKDWISLTMWMFKLVGLKYQEMNKFDPYKYDTFSMNITTGEGNA